MSSPVLTFGANFALWRSILAFGVITVFGKGKVEQEMTGT